MNSPVSLEALLTHPLVTDLCFQEGADGLRIQADRGEGLQEVQLDAELDLRSWVLERLSESGQSWNAKFPFCDASLKSGHRLHVAFPPLSRTGLLVSLRTLPSADRNRRLRELWSRDPLYPALLRAVRAGESILIAGATGSGKTALLNELISSIDPAERVLALEDTAELSPDHPRFYSLLARSPNADGFGEVTLRDLLRQTLRMRPDRLMLGECRGGEVLDLLQLLNTGHRGAMATLHASSNRDALRRLELLCLLSGTTGLRSSVAKELIAGGLQWIVQLDRNPHRFISEVSRIAGREGDTILLRPEPG